MTIFDLFQLIASNIWTYGITFLFVLTVLVFVHEWGHYIIARLCGVKVETFSIGFGPELFGIDDKHGTRWSFSLIPLGGYVKMFGDTDPASSGHTDEVTDEDTGEKREFTDAEKKEAFFAKSVGQRAAIVFAGPAINFIFAIILFAALFTMSGRIVTLPVATAVIEGSAADKAGFRPHDRVLEINGKPITRFDEIRREVLISLDQQLEIKIDRDGQEMVLQAVPYKVTSEDRFGFKHSRGLLGVVGPNDGFNVEKAVAVNGLDLTEADKAEKVEVVKQNMGRQFTVTFKKGEATETYIVNPPREKNETFLKAEEGKPAILVLAEKAEERIKMNIFQSVNASFVETWEVTAGTLRALGQMVTGVRSATELGGIIRIGAIAGDMAQNGVLALIMFTAILSINLGLINLFPIPMLDGGHLLFYSIEAVKGSPIPEQIQEYAFRLGLAILVGIMLFANLNDIVQLIS